MNSCELTKYKTASQVEMRMKNTTFVGNRNFQSCEEIENNRRFEFVEIISNHTGNRGDYGQIICLRLKMLSTRARL